MLISQIINMIIVSAPSWIIIQFRDDNFRLRSNLNAKNGITWLIISWSNVVSLSCQFHLMSFHVVYFHIIKKQFSILFKTTHLKFTLIQHPSEFIVHWLYSLCGLFPTDKLILNQITKERIMNWFNVYT